MEYSARDAAALGISDVNQTVRIVAGADLEGIFTPDGGINSSAVVASKVRQMGHGKYCAADNAALASATVGDEEDFHQFATKASDVAKQLTDLQENFGEVDATNGETGIPEAAAAAVPLLSLSVQLQGVQVVILDDSHGLAVKPVFRTHLMMDNLSVQMTGTGGGKNRYVIEDLMLRAEYMNLRAGVWEPVIEKATFCLEAVMHTPDAYKDSLVKGLTEYRRTLMARIQDAKNQRDPTTEMQLTMQLSSYPPKEKVPPCMAVNFRAPQPLLLNVTPELISVLFWFLPYIQTSLVPPSAEQVSMQLRRALVADVAFGPLLFPRGALGPVSDKYVSENAHLLVGHEGVLAQNDEENQNADKAGLAFLRAGDIYEITTASVYEPTQSVDWDRLNEVARAAKTPHLGSVPTLSTTVEESSAQTAIRMLGVGKVTAAQAAASYRVLNMTSFPYTLMAPRSLPGVDDARLHTVIPPSSAAVSLDALVEGGASQESLRSVADRDKALLIAPIMEDTDVTAMAHLFPTTPRNLLIADYLATKSIHRTTEHFTVVAANGSATPAMQAVLEFAPPPTAKPVSLSRDAFISPGIPTCMRQWESSAENGRPLPIPTQERLLDSAVVGAVISPNPGRKLLLLSTAVQVFNHSGVPLELGFLDGARHLMEFEQAFPGHRVVSQSFLTDVDANIITRIRQIGTSSRPEKVEQQVSSDFLDGDEEDCRPDPVVSSVEVRMPSLRSLPKDLVHLSSATQASKYTRDEIRKRSKQNPNQTTDELVRSLKRTVNSVVLPHGHFTCVPEAALLDTNIASTVFRPAAFISGESGSSYELTRGWSHSLDSASLLQQFGDYDSLKVSRVCTVPGHFQNGTCDNAREVFFRVAIKRASTGPCPDDKSLEIHIYPALTLVNVAPCALTFQLAFKRVAESDTDRRRVIQSLPSMTRNGSVGLTGQAGLMVDVPPRSSLALFDMPPHYQTSLSLKNAGVENSEFCTPVEDVLGLSGQLESSTGISVTCSQGRFAPCELEITRGGGVLAAVQRDLSLQSSVLVSAPRWLIDRSGCKVRPLVSVSEAPREFPLAYGEAPIYVLGPESESSHNALDLAVMGVTRSATGHALVERQATAKNVIVPMVGDFSSVLLKYKDFFTPLSLQTDEIDLRDVGGSLCKIVSVLPQCVLTNSLPVPLEIKQAYTGASGQSVTVEPGKTVAVRWTMPHPHPEHLTVRPLVQDIDGKFVYRWSQAIEPSDDRAGTQMLALLSSKQLELEKALATGTAALDASLCSHEHIATEVQIVATRGVKSIHFAPAARDLLKGVSEVQHRILRADDAKSQSDPALRLLLEKEASAPLSPGLSTRGVVLINNSVRARRAIAKMKHSSDDVKRLQSELQLPVDRENFSIAFTVKTGAARALAWLDPFRQNARKLSLSFAITSDLQAPSQPLELTLDPIDFRAVTRTVTFEVPSTTVGQAGKSYSVVVSTERRGDLYLVQLFDLVPPETAERTRPVIGSKDILPEHAAHARKPSVPTDELRGCVDSRLLHDLFAKLNIKVPTPFSICTKHWLSEKTMGVRESSAAARPASDVKCPMSHPEVLKQFNITPEKLDEILLGASLQVSIRSIGLSLVSHRQREEVLFVEVRQLFLHFIQYAENQTIDLRVGDLQVDSQVVDSRRTAAAAFLAAGSGSAVLPAELLDDKAVVLAPQGNARSNFFSILVKRNFCNAADLVLEEVRITMDVLEVSLRDAAFYSLQAYVDECFDALEGASQASNSVSQGSRVRVSEILKWTNNSSSFYEEWRAPPVPLVFLIGKLAVSKLQLLIWCQLSLLRLHYLPSVVRTLLKVISFSGSLSLTGAPINLDEETFSIRGSAAYVANEFTSRYQPKVITNILPLLAHSSLVNIPAVPLKLAARSMDKAFGTVRSGFDLVGSAVSQLTMDSSYISKRQQDARQTPASVGEGLKNAGRNMGEAVVGLTSIVTAPIQGAQKKGFSGFINGLGKGLIGSVVKPIDKLGQAVGSIASGVQSEIQKTANGQVKFRTTRQRPPRPLWGSYGLLRTFDLEEARTFLALGGAAELNKGTGASFVSTGRADVSSAPSQSIEEIVRINSQAKSYVVLIFDVSFIRLVEIITHWETASAMADADGPKYFRELWRTRRDRILDVRPGNFGLEVRVIRVGRSDEILQVPMAAEVSAEAILSVRRKFEKYIKR